MRRFKRYIPELIAKHTMRLFSGQVYIYGIGQFEFNEGKLVLPKQAEHQHYRTVNEVNQEVMKLRCAYV